MHVRPLVLGDSYDEPAHHSVLVEMLHSIFIIHDMVYNTLSLSSADYVEVIVCMLPPIVVYNNVYFLLGTTGQPSTATYQHVLNLQTSPQCGLLS